MAEPSAGTAPPPDAEIAADAPERPEVAGIPPDQPVAAQGELGKWGWLALPIVSYTSDLGVTLGAAVMLYRQLSTEPPVQENLTASVSWASRGPRAFDVTWDRPRLLERMGVKLNLHLGDDTLFPYWGEGSQLGGLSEPAGSGSPPEPYRYHDRRVFAAAVLKGPVAGALAWHARFRYVNVSVLEPSDLLVSSAPPGYQGASEGIGEVGLAYDTRDRPLATRHGMYLTLAAFAAPHVGGLSDYAFHGWNLGVRVYVPTADWLTFAARAMYDAKKPGPPFGGSTEADAVPFFERMLYEGVEYGEGLGGAGTLRGIARYRVSGEEKLMFNIQARARVWTFRLLGKPQELGVSAGVDAGRAFQGDYPAISGTGLELGLRLVWDKAVLLRVEAAQAPGGDRSLYIAFGEQF